MLRYSELEAYFAYLKHWPRVGASAWRRLNRIRALLKDLGQPEKQYLSIQVVGTSGKGSTAAMLEAMLKAAGYRVGLSTSPHLVEPTERIRLNGRHLKRVEFARLINELVPAVERVERLLNDRPTFFEVLTAAAAYAFVQAQVDVAIFEAGLGGRADATTALNSKIHVITSINLDHAEVLGRSLSDIVNDKSRIGRRGDLFITSAEGRALRLLTERFRRRGLPLTNACSELRGPIKIGWDGTEFDFEKLSRLKTNLIGPHQAVNAAAALQTIAQIKALGFSVPEAAIRSGLARVHWPGRFQVIGRNPKIILDGAHNPAKMKALVKTLDALKIPRSRIACLFACKATKNSRAMLDQLGPRVGQIYFPLLETEENFTHPVELQNIWPTGRVSWSVDSTFKQAKRGLGPAGYLLVTGSLHLVGRLLRLLIHR